MATQTASWAFVVKYVQDDRPAETDQADRHGHLPVVHVVSLLSPPSSCHFVVTIQGQSSPAREKLHHRSQTGILRSLLMVGNRF